MQPRATRLSAGVESQWHSGSAEWPEAMALGGLLHGEEILAIRIHVLEPRGGEMREVVLLHWEALNREPALHRYNIEVLSLGG